MCRFLKSTTFLFCDKNKEPLRRSQQEYKSSLGASPDFPATRRVGNVPVMMAHSAWEFPQCRKSPSCNSRPSTPASSRVSQHSPFTPPSLTIAKNSKIWNCTKKNVCVKLSLFSYQGRGGGVGEKAAHCFCLYNFKTPGKGVFFSNQIHGSHTCWGGSLSSWNNCRLISKLSFLRYEGILFFAFIALEC